MYKYHELNNSIFNKFGEKNKTLKKHITIISFKFGTKYLEGGAYPPKFHVEHENIVPSWLAEDHKEKVAKEEYEEEEKIEEEAESEEEEAMEK